MPTYKLTYFNAKARGEVIRILFAAVGQKYEDRRVDFSEWPELKPTKYEDRRVDFSEWPELKPKMPHGVLPVLEIDGGKIVVSQSMAIARYLAREFKMYGRNNTEALYIDQIIDTLMDMFDQCAKFLLEKDEAKKAAMRKTFDDVTAPRYLGNLEKCLCGKDGFAVGSCLSVADVILYNHLDVSSLGGNLDKYPKLKANRKKVEQNKNIGNYLKARPVLPF